jgi:hypothetical protein
MSGNVEHETETIITAGIHQQKHANASILVDENPLYAFRVDKLETNGTVRLVSVWCDQTLGAGPKNGDDDGFPVVNNVSDLIVRSNRPANRQRTNRGLYRIGVIKAGGAGTTSILGRSSDDASVNLKNMVFLDSWELEASRVPIWWTYRDSSSQWWSFVPFRQKPISYSLAQFSLNMDIQNSFSVTIQNNEGKYLRRIKPIVENMNRVPHVRFDSFAPSAGTLPSSFVWHVRSVSGLHHLYTVKSSETDQYLGLQSQKNTFDLVNSTIALPRKYFIIEHAGGVGEKMRFSILSAYSFTQYPEDYRATSVVHTDLNSYAMNLDKTKRKTKEDSTFTITVVRDLSYCLKNAELMSSTECKLQCGKTTNTRNMCNEKINRFCGLSLKNMLTSDVCQAFCNDTTNGVKVNDPSCRIGLQKLCKNATADERSKYSAECACFFDTDYYTSMLERTFPSRLFQKEQAAVKDLSPVCWFPACAKQDMNWKKPKDASCTISSMQPFSECLKVQLSKDVGNYDAYKNHLITECVGNSSQSGGRASDFEIQASSNYQSYVPMLLFILVLLILLASLRR